jgi:hypothetical protein
MQRRLFDTRMADGSRHFGDLPETYDAARPEWHRIRDAVPHLAGAELTGFVTDDVTEAWIDFAFRGHAFSINDQHGDWWFFVRDPSCPDDVLLEVLDHFEAVLSPHVAAARRRGPLARGTFRVLVYEPDARITSRDFDALAEARTYADDAASEIENGPVLSLVFDDTPKVVHRGRHY